MKPERVTQHPNANEQLLYFTSSSLWSDDSHLVFLSDCNGYPNVFQMNLSTGKETKLTDNSTGILKSYVYFSGIPYRGLGKASISLHSPSGTLYYLQGREIRKVDPSGDIIVLNQYPEGQMTAFTHVSADGTRLCVPTTDARALDEDKVLKGTPPYNIDGRVQKEGLYSYLRVYDTKTGEEIFSEPVHKAWITHVQFSPKNRDVILYNHEWPSDCGIRRMWLFDGKNHIRLRPEGDTISKNDWACHEMWERSGEAIIYHGGYHRGPKFIGRVTPDGLNRVEIPISKRFRAYGHFTVGEAGVLVSDGYFREKWELFNLNGRWISKLDVDWNSGTITWNPLIRSKSSWKSQDAHPHPIIDRGNKYAYFTSDFEGKRAVYRVKLTDPQKKALSPVWRT